MKAVEPSMISEYTAHPERELFEKVISGEVKVKFHADGKVHEVDIFAHPERERHMFIDLDGDNIEEMYMRTTFCGWPAAFFTIKNGEVWQYDLDKNYELSTSGMLEHVYFDSDKNIIIAEHMHVGRESYAVFHVYDNVITFIKGYNRVWEQYDETMLHHSFKYGSEIEISAEEYDAAVKEIMKDATEPVWIKEEN